MYVQLLDYRKTPMRILATIRMQGDEIVIDGELPPGMQADIEDTASRYPGERAFLHALTYTFSGVYLRAKLVSEKSGQSITKTEDPLDPGWTVTPHQLTRTFTFENRRQCAAFLVDLYREANLVNHHPDVETVPNGARVTFTTHSAGNRVTEVDYLGASRADELARRHCEVHYSAVLKGGPGSGRYPKGSGGWHQVKAPQSVLDSMGQPDGGFTYSPTTGKEPKVGFALSVHPDRGELMDASHASTDALAAFVSKNWDLLKKPGNYVGGWHNPDDGKVYLDVSTVVKTAAQAEKLGREARQIAYFDLVRGVSVKIAME